MVWSMLRWVGRYSSWCRSKWTTKLTIWTALIWHQRRWWHLIPKWKINNNDNWIHELRKFFFFPIRCEGDQMRSRTKLHDQMTWQKSHKPPQFLLYAGQWLMTRKHTRTYHLNSIPYLGSRRKLAVSKSGKYLKKFHYQCHVVTYMGK